MRSCKLSVKKNFKNIHNNTSIIIEQQNVLMNKNEKPGVTASDFLYTFYYTEDSDKLKLLDYLINKQTNKKNLLIFLSYELCSDWQ